MKNLLLILIFWISNVSGNTIDSNCPSTVIWGAPANQTVDQYLCRIDYAVGYSYKTKTPQYVVEYIITNHLKKNVRRKNNFREDLEIPENYRQTLKDYYSYESIDKGHMAPAGDFTYDSKVMSESFLLSNIVPQNNKLNRIAWNHLESNIRSIVTSSGLYVITGTIFNLNHNTIGNGVGIPDFLFKIVIDPEHERMIAFKIPNEPIDVHKLRNYVVSVTDLEKNTGIDFSPEIPKNLKHLETEVANYSSWF